MLCSLSGGGTFISMRSTLVPWVVFPFLSLLALSATSRGHPGHDDDHVHDLEARANPSLPITVPTRPLTWGNVNIIHTTDTHGWLLGHQKPTPPEPNYRYVLILQAFTILYERCYTAVTLVILLPLSHI